MVGLLFPEKAEAAKMALKNCTDLLMNSTSVNLTSSAAACLNNDHANVKMYIGIFIGIMSALASSIVAVLLKKLTSIKVHFSIAIVYAAYVGLPIALILSVIMYFTGLEKKDMSHYKTPADIAWQCAYTLTSGLAGIGAQVTLQKALQYEDASRVSVIRCTDLFFTFLLQYLLLNLTANVYSTTGAVLIFSATFLTLIHKIIDQKYNALRKGKKNKGCVKKCVFFEL